MSEILPTPSARDFDLLRSARRNRAGRVVVTAALALLAFLFLGLFVTYLLRLRLGEAPVPRTQLAQLTQLHQRWSTNFVQEIDLAYQWFEHHGTATEAALFEGLSGVVVSSVLGSNSATLPEEDLSSFGRIFLTIHISIVRVLFFAIASFRLCIAVGLLAFVRGLFAFKPYRAVDALGQMGNGRVFYSGAYAALEGVTPEGVPDRLIRGFACPQTCSLTQAKASPLWGVLSSFDVANPTNIALVRILVKNSNTAPYVALPGEEGELAQVFSDTDLASNAASLLKEVLEVHNECRLGNQQSIEGLLGSTALGDAAMPYASRVATALRLALTPQLRAALGTISPAEVATFVLAFESGKVLAHSFEGERWVRRSNFIHLSARAVLHSLGEYPQDYDPESRARIRCALVYAARKSPFAPIRLPIGLDPARAALRQWAEVLLACPHELQEVAIELELFALVREAHAEWQTQLFDGAGEMFHLLRERGFATRTELLFVPLEVLTSTIRRVVPLTTIERMRQLLESLATTQAKAEGAAGEGEGGVQPTFSFDRVHPMPPRERVASLAAAHSIKQVDVQDWLVLRYVLSSFGWLASRVGDYSVPETSAVFAVFQATPPLPGTNSFGRLGKPGMIPLRGSNVRELLGTAWSAYFTMAERVTIAETEREYERLLQGIEERLSPEEVDQDVSSTVGTQR